jgi:ribosomal protein S10
MFISIHIYSKNYNSLLNFVKHTQKSTFFKNKLKLYNQNYFFKKTKIFTVLKSPHVNKTAQEHFEFDYYTKYFKIYSKQNLVFLLFLKSLKRHLFFDIQFKIKIINQPQKQKIKLKNKINPDNFTLINNNFVLKDYLKVVDSYGILLLN